MLSIHNLAVTALTVAVGLCALPSRSLALNNGLARTPQMGWNSWNHFVCSIDESLIRSTAQAIIASGLSAAGYTYVNLDDCWQVDRAVDGSIIADPAAFPSGIKALADDIHALGLKFGLYSDCGQFTCQGRPGGLNYEKKDAHTYASWGVDYLKYDNCNDDGIKPETRYPPMRDALNATGRPILFSMCEWGVDDPARWSGEIGNSWRTTGDISDNWNSMTSNLDQNDKWWNYSGPGHWNDPDMLEVGNGGMTDDEYQAHFSLWCLIKSPLLIGCDVTKMSDSTKTILMNQEVIALSQDDLGVQGHKLYSQDGAELWAGPLANGDVGVILFNRGNSSANITISWEEHLGMNPHTSVAVRDLVQHKDLGSFSSSYSAYVNRHASQTLRLSMSSPAKGKRFGLNVARRYKSINQVYDDHPRMAAVLGGRRMPQ